MNEPASASMDRMGPFRRSRPRALEAAPCDPRTALADALGRAGRGDESAFAVVYDALAGLVHGVVTRVVRDPSLAEEVTQEVFVELWRIAPRYEAGRGSPQAWASTIAHRRAVDRVRSSEAARARDDAHARSTSTHDRAITDPVAEAVTTRLDSERVTRALDQLSESQREAVTLAYHGGHTYRDVATLLGIPEGTAKTRIRDALIRLRDHMEVTT